MNAAFGSSISIELLTHISFASNASSKSMRWLLSNEAGILTAY